MAVRSFRTTGARESSPKMPRPRRRLVYESLGLAGGQLDAHLREFHRGGGEGRESGVRRGRAHLTATEEAKEMRRPALLVAVVRFSSVQELRLRLRLIQSCFVVVVAGLRPCCLCQASTSLSLLRPRQLGWPWTAGQQLYARLSPMLPRPFAQCRIAIRQCSLLRNRLHQILT
ncbi:hypothetical protein C2845_PM14G02170 [Panicum miliaceum]|uniref:Uncharacterized protein n=1 Tax=Panicum miliaceum TaxID=4540 RepID=A0A3L6PPW6_PANMI|nr:hypothetical protein C2845_PM14G02170 [Panicum miliaceum]